MALYNLTNLTATDASVFTYVKFINNSTQGLLVGLFVLAIFIVLMSIMLIRLGDFIKAMLVSSFITFFVGILFTSIGLFSIYLSLIFLGLGAFCLIILFSSNSNN